MFVSALERRTDEKQKIYSEMFLCALAAFPNYQSITALFIQPTAECRIFARNMKGCFRGLLKIFKITDEMRSIMAVTDVSDDVIRSDVQSAFTEREQRILDQLCFRKLWCLSQIRLLNDLYGSVHR